MSSSADQLAQEVTEARVAEFGDDTGIGQFPSRFFSHDVTVKAPNGQVTPRNPQYCATNYGAAAIARVMLDAGMPCSLVLANAINGEAVFADSEPVPFCRFKNSADAQAGPYTGPNVNAGLMLAYFNHGNSGDVSLSRAQQEALEVFGEAGLKP
jgi:hypothetical protein